MKYSPQIFFHGMFIAKHLGKCQFPSSTYSLISLALICIHLPGCVPVDILYYYTMMTSFTYLFYNAWKCDRYITHPQYYFWCKNIKVTLTHAGMLHIPTLLSISSWAPCWKHRPSHCLITSTQTGASQWDTSLASHPSCGSPSIWSTSWYGPLDLSNRSVDEGWKEVVCKMMETWIFSHVFLPFLHDCLVLCRGWRCVWDLRGPYQTSTPTASTWLLCHRGKKKHLNTWRTHL